MLKSIEFSPTKFTKGQVLVDGYIMTDNYGFIYLHETDEWLQVNDFGKDGKDVNDALFVDFDYSKFTQIDKGTVLANVLHPADSYYKRFEIAECDVGIKDLDDSFLFCTLEIQHKDTQNKKTTYTFIKALITEDDFTLLNKEKTFDSSEYIINELSPIQRFMEIGVNPWS